MLKDIGLLGIVFAIVPGFIADIAFRACWGMEKGEEFERTLRSIIWSVLGLVLLIAIGRTPPYLNVIVGTAGASPPLDRSAGIGFVLHIVSSALIAGVTGWIATGAWTHRVFTALFRRSLPDHRPWDLLWLREKKGRGVKVVLKNGHVYGGSFSAASTGSDEKELMLRDPMIRDDGGSFVPLVGTRILYLPQDEISEVHLTFTDEERDANVKREEGNKGIGTRHHDEGPPSVRGCSAPDCSTVGRGLRAAEREHRVGDAENPAARDKQIPTGNSARNSSARDNN